MERKTTYSVMVSSTYAELTEHRRAVRDAMLGQRLLPIAMEDDAALPDQDLIDASLTKIDEEDAYVGLISYRYGQMPESPERNPDRLSLTELEFRRAVARGIPICIFIMHKDHLVPRSAVGEERGAEQKLESFLSLAEKDRIYAEFKSVEDLKTKAVQSLVALREALERRASASSSTSRDAEHGALEGKRFVLSNIPINVPLHFLGRDDELAAIDAALKSEKGRITALHGLRGVGKTTLAAAYAERHGNDYRAAWWIRAQAESTMRADLVSLGVRLGWVAADENEEPALERLRERLRHEGEGLLLVYDNAIDAASLRPYLLSGGAARVLITSNARTWRGVAAPVEIRVWPKEIGADYLIARTGRDKERADAEALSLALGGLPLAHEQAAAYCERLDVSLADYQSRFEATPARLLDTNKDAPTDYYGGRTVAKTFALAINEATKLHPAAEPFIVLCALLAPVPIPLFLFTEGKEAFGEFLGRLFAEEELDEAVSALRSFALVDRESIADERNSAIRTETIRLHRLVRVVAAQRLPSEAVDVARRALIWAMDKAFPQTSYNDPTAWPKSRRLDTLALDLVGGESPLPKGAETSASRLLNKVGSFWHGALGASSQARLLFERALVISENAVGAEHPDIAPLLNNLGLLVQFLGDLKSARRYFERSLAIGEKALGDEHPDIATGLNNLANTLQLEGDYETARTLYERALKINEQMLGEEHPRTLNTLSGFSALLKEQGDLAGARRLCERALQGRERALGLEHPDVGTSNNNLAGILEAQSEFNEARVHYELALAVLEKSLGPDHPSTSLARRNYAHLYLVEGEPLRALELSEIALTALETALGRDHGWTKASATIKANALEALGRRADAAAVRTHYEIGNSANGQ